MALNHYQCYYGQNDPICHFSPEKPPSVLVTIEEGVWGGGWRADEDLDHQMCRKYFLLHNNETFPFTFR